MSKKDDPDEPDPTWSESLRDSRSAAKLVFQTDPKQAIASAVLGLVAALFAPAIAWTAREIVSAVEHAAQISDEATRNHVLMLVGVELVLVVSSTALRRGGDLIGSLLNQRVGQRINETILEKSLALELADFENPEVLDRMTRARREASYRPTAHVSNVLSFVQSLVSFFGLGALLSTLSLWSFVALAVATIPVFISELYFDKESFRLFSWRSPETRKQNYLEMLLARADYAKEIKLFGLGPVFLERYRAIFTALWDDDKRLAIRRNLASFGLQQLGTLSFYALYGWVAWLAATGTLSLAEMTMALVAFRRAREALHDLLTTSASLLGDRPYLRTLFSFLEHPSSVRNNGTESRGPTPGDGIRFEEVTFSYPEAEKPVLDGISFHLPAKGKLALVGENGAGKTTLIKLLTRLYRPTSGRITLDGLPLDQWDETALRARIGVIFQDFVQYQFTLGENIGVGDVTGIDDEARWTIAAEKGMANEVVRDMPDGWKTQLGKWFDKGRELSLGQWQKVALSRAFMREDADILVLDEPTASMDAEAEARIFARFRSLTESRSAILISHRFSTVRMADTILVIDGGRIVESGSHHELMAKSGKYAHLFTLQAQGYR